jgi:hypothetical protein
MLKIGLSRFDEEHDLHVSLYLVISGSSISFQAIDVICFFYADVAY